MAAITISSDFGAQKNKVWQFPLFPHLFAMKFWDQMPWSLFSECWALTQLTCLLRNLYAGQEATVRTGHGTTHWYQIGKGVCQTVYCHPAHLTSMQSTSWEMLDWNKHKLEARLPGEISVTSHYFMGNRWGNSRNSVRLHFLGLQNHCRWWLQPWN